MAPTASRTRQTSAAATARRRTAPPPPIAGAALDFEPIRITADEDVPEERVPLFYIGDVEYTTPKHVAAGFALQYLRVARESGPEAGAGALLSRVLGDESYQALEQSRGLTNEQLDKIIGIVLDLALGRSEKGGKART